MAQIIWAQGSRVNKGQRDTLWPLIKFLSMLITDQSLYGDLASSGITVNWIDNWSFFRSHPRNIMNQISQQMSQGQIHITSCQVNIFSVKSKQRILDRMENYLHWSIIRRQRRTGRTRSGLTRRPSTISTGTRAAPFPPGRKTSMPLKMTPCCWLLKGL